MKKVSGLLTAMTMLFVLGLFSCGGGGGIMGNTPGDKVKKGVKLLYDKQYEAVVKMYVKKEGEKLTAEESAKLAGMMPMALKQKESKQGLKDVEIIEEKISEDGNKATVSYKVIYNNGETENESAKLIKVSGDWYLVIGN
ncbi:MAG: DUF4878 domain-containing protein [Bacteroidales bacterium]|jgi:hypothetical protein|nr:DUF4878 domain-containing protein [Bacteroidales bacterium]